MNVTRHSDANFEAQLIRAAGGSSLFDPVIDERTRTIVESVRAKGDAALVELPERFDGAKLTAAGLAVPAAELAAAMEGVDEALKAAVADAHKSVQVFASKSLRVDWQTKNHHGAAVGEKFDPFQRVGIYIPGGTAPLVSTALMTVTLAKTAGCPEIVVCTPPGKDGKVNPALLYAAQVAGATEIYKVGGAQAIAAMALGTGKIARVQKVFGPGNAYVVAAKRLLFGYVAVDLLPGPSEVLVLADDSANPKFVAADLLAQAEHGSGHERVWMITTSGKLLKAVEKEVNRQLAKLSRRTFIEKALNANGWLIHVEELDHAIALANRLAPEHCEIMTAHARDVARRVTTAGAIFLGDYSPTVLGDYVAGPSHELPTGGAGRSFAGLTVDQFQRRTSVVEYGKGALKQALASVQKFAQVEGLDAHGRSATIRADK